MSRPSRSIIDVFKDWFRKIIAPALSELAKSGKIIQTLWDAAQLQKLQKENLIRLGHLASKAVREGRIEDIHMERLVAKIEQSERILERQDLILKSFQNQGDLKRMLLSAERDGKDHLEPI
jgi:hypothetical protein